MTTRRTLVFAAIAGLALLASSASQAFEFKAYDAAAVASTIASGKPVVVHVFAPWCLQCRAQEAILNRLSTDASYDDISFFRVDYDRQKDVVKALDVPRSTLIAYQGGAETTRMSWGTSTESVLGVLAAVN